MPDDFTRLLWVMLPLGVDREGRGLDNASWVKAKLMPLRTDVALEQVEAALPWYAERGLIQRYVVEGRRYFWASSFREQQGNAAQEAPSRIPPPPVGEPTAGGTPYSGASPDRKPIDSEASPDPVQSDSASGPVTDVDTDIDVDVDAITTRRASAPPPDGGLSLRTPSWETDETLEDDEHMALTGLQRPFLELCEASYCRRPMQPMTILALDLLQTYSGPGPVTDIGSDSDADAEEDAGDGAPASSPSSVKPGGNTAEEKLKLTLGQRQFLELFGGPRRHNRTQAEAVQALERAHGTECLVDAARWAGRRRMGSRQAVVAVEAVSKEAEGKRGRNSTWPGRTGAPSPKAPAWDAAGPALEVLPGITRERALAHLVRRERSGGGKRVPPFLTIRSFGVR